MEANVETIRFWMPFSPMPGQPGWAYSLYSLPPGCHVTIAPTKCCLPSGPSSFLLVRRYNTLNVSFTQVSDMSRLPLLTGCCRPQTPDSSPIRAWSGQRQMQGCRSLSERAIFPLTWSAWHLSLPRAAATPHLSREQTVTPLRRGLRCNPRDFASGLVLLSCRHCILQHWHPEHIPRSRVLT